MAKYHDPVNHPQHYCQGDIECIDAIKASMQISEFIGYCKGNAMKYIWRAGYKGSFVEDIDKAIFYLSRIKKEVVAESVCTQINSVGVGRSSDVCSCDSEKR